MAEPTINPPVQEPPNPFGMDFSGQTAALAAKLSAPVNTPAAAPEPVIDNTPATPDPAAVAPIEPVATDTPAPAATDTPAPEAKPFWEEPKVYPGEEAPAPVGQVPAAPAEDPYKDIAPLLSDPEVQMILELKKAGKSIKDYAEQIKVVDFKTMTPEQLLEYDVLRYGGTKEDVEAELETFAEKPIYERNKESEVRRAQLEGEQAQRVSAFTNDIKQEHARSSQEQAAYNARILQEREAIINDMVGKEFQGGFVLGEREAKALRYRCEYGFPEWYEKNADGTPNYDRVNLKRFITDVAKLDFSEGITSSVISKNFNNGKEVILDKVTNASKGEQGSPTNTSVDPIKAMQEVADTMFKPKF